MKSKKRAFFSVVFQTKINASAGVKTKALLFEKIRNASFFLFLIDFDGARVHAINV